VCDSCLVIFVTLAISLHHVRVLNNVTEDETLKLRSFLKPRGRPLQNEGLMNMTLKEQHWLLRSGLKVIQRLGEFLILRRTVQ